ncbi:MAG: PH domain-containing protein [Pseudanabaena sp. ELA607]|jgi:uncharacterized membrane protein YdbT with pleckstrin-like domain
MKPKSRHSSEITLFQGNPAVIGSLGRLLAVIFSLGIMGLWYWLKSINTKYLITSERIVVEKGILSQRIETVEIYQIDDIELDKPFGQRIMGTANMRLFTRDVSAPTLVLERLPVDIRQLYEQMRSFIQDARRQRRINNHQPDERDW